MSKRGAEGMQDELAFMGPVKGATITEVQKKIEISKDDYTQPEQAKEFVDAFMQNKIVDANALDQLPPEIQKELYFTIGARGVNVLMQGLLKLIRNDDDLEALATLSTVRHKLLEMNASATHT